MKKISKIVFETELREPLPNGQHYFWADNHTELLVVKDAKSVRAFGSICPHMGARLGIRNGKLSCPWHELDFDLETLSGNHPKYQRACEYQVEISGGTLRVYK